MREHRSLLFAERPWATNRHITVKVLAASVFTVEPHMLQSRVA